MVRIHKAHRQANQEDQINRIIYTQQRRQPIIQQATTSISHNPSGPTQDRYLQEMSMMHLPKQDHVYCRHLPNIGLRQQGTITLNQGIRIDPDHTPHHHHLIQERSPILHLGPLRISQKIHHQCHQGPQGQQGIMAPATNTRQNAVLNTLSKMNKKSTALL